MTETDTIARLTRERDEARERAASLSRELLDAMQARDHKILRAFLAALPAEGEGKTCPGCVGMRREFEELLGCGDTIGDAAFERGLARLRKLVAAEKDLAEFSKILSRHNHEWSERCELAESRAERLEAALREIADECDCDFPRCQSTIARAALGEEGK